jgi:hypothetical protein
MNETGFPKIKLSGVGTFKPPKKTKLSKKSKVGEYVSWTVNARTYEGVLEEWQDPNTAVVKLFDSRKIAVEL